ncbi:hypothetical protein CRUP_034307 [Coryphaenoides rupestris]|nr:hypothetical protein CRUP_034307 [Coryphaenoides rupestris]
MIERARAKRAWEASLPPLEDLAQLDKRRRMMQAMECQEWAFREGEIQKLQETRLAVLKDLLSQQDRAQNQTTAPLRKLTAQRNHVEGKFEQRNVAAAGPAADRNHCSRVVKSRFLNTYTGLLELEVSLPAAVLEPRIKAPKPRDTRRFVSHRERRDMELIKTHEALKEEKEGKGHVEPSKPLRFLVKKEKPPPGRPATPRVHPPPEVSQGHTESPYLNS